MCRRPALLSLLLLLLALDGCAASSAAQPSPSSRERSSAAAGVPGFDTREYPGDAVMARWREASPYRWVGYYLTAPCFTGTSWRGRRQALEGMGWGMAVLFVGEQAWAPGSEPPPDSVPARCTRRNVTAARGEADAREAVATARAEGFPAGTVLYLDVERGDSVPTAQASYVSAWARSVRAARYTPGLYAHARNAEALLAEMSGDEAEAADVPLWVARETGFGLDAVPAASGFDDARAWQGAFDRRETWGDLPASPLRVDLSVATSASPSAPR